MQIHTTKYGVREEAFSNLYGQNCLGGRYGYK